MADGETTETAEIETAQTVQADTIQAEVVHTQTGLTQAAKVEPAQVETVNAQVAQSGVVQTEIVQAEATQTEAERMQAKSLPKNPVRRDGPEEDIPATPSAARAVSLPLPVCPEAPASEHRQCAPTSDRGLCRQAPEQTQTVRIGIDVGGTFTHAVALDSQTLDILGRVKVPTTHQAPEGVARGIIDSLQQLLAQANIAPEQVTFIAHSTTQATNALLEGDVATVGILGMGKGNSAWLAKLGTEIKSLELAPGKFLKTHCEFYDTSNGVDRGQIQAAIARLREKGAQAIAVSEAFSVDEPANEETVRSIAQELGLPATCGSEVSKLYGLKVRTRTAVINAAMLPKMIETADMTEASVRQSGILAPIMIMRSDGGVMDIEAMRRLPILTMLSGPAAGVAAAMMYLNISDGIFLEVGGTSTDISVIKNGKALVKGAEIGGHKVYMRTLDVKTLGVAGGSIFRTRDKEIVDVGPRSAHIAGLGYISFHEPLTSPHFVHIQPKPADPDDYLAIATGESVPPSLCLTPTCAANLLGLVPENNPARGRLDSVTAAFQALSTQMHGDAQVLATTALTIAYKKCLPTIEQFISDYKLDKQTITLVGGGGGAAALVPFIAKQMNVEVALAENADVVSAIGVALALVRECVERNIVQPKQEDILRIRQEAFLAVQKMGADPASIEIHVEVDSRANIVRATAFGAAGLHGAGVRTQALEPVERLEMAAKSMHAAAAGVKTIAKTAFFEVFACETIDRRLFGLLPSKHQSLRVMDEKGIIRLQTRNGIAVETTAAEADQTILDLAETYSRFGDAGKILPNIMLLTGARIVDLSGIPEANQIVSLAKTELSSAAPETATVIIAGLD